MADKNKRSVLLSAVEMHTSKDSPPKKHKGLMSAMPESYLYPSMYLNDKQAPDLEGKKVGDEFTLVVKGKLTSCSVRECNGKKEENYTFQVNKIGLIK